MLVFILLLSIITVLPFIQGESAEEENVKPEAYVEPSELSPAEINKIETELNKRLVSTRIQPFFSRARIQEGQVNLFVERDGWKALSLNEKADALSQVAKTYRDTVREIIGEAAKPSYVKTEIYFFDKDSDRELAFWSEGSGIIID